MRDLLATLTEEVWQLERQVTAGMGGDPQQFLEELFAVRHGLLAIRTMGALSREVYGRMATLGVWAGAGHAMLLDLEDQFRRIFAMAEGQREYLQGVIEFYQARTNTKMTIAAERLAVIAAVTPGDGPVVDPRDERHRQREHTRRPARRPARGDGRHVHGAAHLGSTQGLVVSDHRRLCPREPPAARWPETPTRPRPPRRCWRDGGTGPR